MTTPNPTPPLYRLRAGRALVLGLFAMGAVAWIVTVPGIVGALIAGIPLAALTPKFARLTTPLIATFGAALTGAIVGAMAYGQGAGLIRLVAGIIAGVAAAPWCVVLAFMLWTRARGPGGTL